MKTCLSLLPVMLVLAMPLQKGHAAARYVDKNRANPTPPYTNRATAANVIQDAVDVALPGDEIVVTNGVYQMGGRAVYPGMTNRVAVTKPLTLRSVNGPDVTVIRGYQVPGTTNGDSAVRCVYLTNGASLSGFTLTNGATLIWNGIWFEGTESEVMGGGIYCASPSAVVSNCVLIGNSAYDKGGAAYGGTLNNCRLTANSARAGGGASASILNNCTLTGNWTTGKYGDGGGSYGGILSNCTLVDNIAAIGGDHSGA